MEAISDKLLRYLPLISLGLFVSILAMIWRLTPLQELADPDQLQIWLEGLRQQWWLAFAVIPSYVLAHLILFPNMVLNAAVIIGLGGIFGWALALTASLFSASLFFLAGFRFGNRVLKPLPQDRLNRLRQLLRRGGLLAVISIRMVPIAPYPVVNSAAGAIRIRFIDFFFGTAIAHLPGTLTLALAGEQLGELLREPSPKNILLLLLILSLGVSAAVLLRRWILKRLEAK